MGGEQVARRQEQETRNKFYTYFLSPTPPVNLVVLFTNNRICSELTFLAFPAVSSVRNEQIRL